MKNNIKEEKRDDVREEEKKEEEDKNNIKEEQKKDDVEEKRDDIKEEERKIDVNEKKIEDKYLYKINKPYNNKGISKRILLNIQVPWLSNTIKIVTQLSDTVKELIDKISTFHLIPKNKIVYIYNKIVFIF